VVRAGALISGRGSNLQAILERIASGRLDCRVALVVSNRPEAPGLAVARDHGVATTVIDHRRFAERDAFDAAVVEALQGAGVELVLLAGFDRLVGRRFIDAFPHRIMNIHPALLPSFKGLHAQRQALEYGVKIAGATVHFVDEHTDHGPIIVQGAVPVEADDDEESLGRRILAVEHEIYSDAIQLFAQGRLRVDGRRVVVSGPRPVQPGSLVRW
jgi:phosphoribosylglycinamide formyltransferase-1